jgi:hypothetical protein
MSAEVLRELGRFPPRLSLTVTAGGGWDEGDENGEEARPEATEENPGGESDEKGKPREAEQVELEPTAPGEHGPGRRAVEARHALARRALGWASQ